jgi:small subunit ribosomal protein S20
LANTSSARKCARQSERHRQHNVALLSRFRTAVKNVVKAIEKGDKPAAVEAYKRAVPVIDSSADKGFLHRNKAARHKSRLNAAIKRLS